MPFALIVIGGLLFATALNNTWKVGPNGGPGLFPQLSNDLFSENGGFLYWVAALIIVGLIGYIPSFKKPADAFLVLILVAMLLKNGGFFQQLGTGLANISKGGSTTGTTTGASAATASPFGGLNLNLPSVFANNGTEPLTTPAPAPAGQSVPLGFGGIGSA